VLETLWTIRFPDDYAVTLSGGNLREVPASAPYAKKVRNLLDQLQKISRTAGETDSAKLRERAYGEIARLEQALGDNLAELESTNRGEQEMAQKGRLTTETLEEQWEGNGNLIRESKVAQGQLREQLKNRGQAQEQAAPSKKEQAFLDTTNYLKRNWRGGKDARPPEGQRPEAPPAAAGGAPGVEDLLGEKPFLNFGAQARVGGEVEVARPEAVDASKGLKPVAEPTATAEAMGFEESPEGKGTISYTFLRSGGGLESRSEISITYTRRDAVPRLAALVLLLAVPGAFLWLGVARRRGRTSPR
jgi:hypothetical protein